LGVADPVKVSELQVLLSVWYNLANTVSTIPVSYYRGIQGIALKQTCYSSYLET